MREVREVVSRTEKAVISGRYTNIVEKQAGWELMSFSNTMWFASNWQRKAMTRLPTALLPPVRALARRVLLWRASSNLHTTTIQPVVGCLKCSCLSCSLSFITTCL